MCLQEEGYKSWEDKCLKTVEARSEEQPRQVCQGRREEGEGEGVEVGVDDRAWSQEGVGGVGEQALVGPTGCSPETWKRQVAEPTSLETLHS